MGAVRRGLPIVLVLFAAYCATLGIGAEPGSRYSDVESHRLLVAESIVGDGDIDLRDEYASRAWEEWDHPRPLEPRAQLTNGRLHEPDGLGLPLLITPAYAVGGAVGVEVFLAALLALAFAVAAGLARRLVDDPWPRRAVLVVGLSPPALAASTTISAATAGALLLTVALALALRIRDDPRVVRAFACALVLVLIPWLAIGLLVPAVVIAVAIALWLRHVNRGLVGFTVLEVVTMGAVFYVAVHDRLYGGPTPDFARAGGAGEATGVGGVTDVLERLPRLLGVFVDRDVGLVRWAPFLVLALGAAWLVHRSVRERVALVVPGRADAEVAARLLLAVCVAGLVVAALAPRGTDGPWLTQHHAPALLPALAALAAWGAHHAGRAATPLAAVTLAGSLWLLVAGRLDDGVGLGPPSGALPWGGVEGALPSFGEPVTVGALVACGVVVLASVAVVVRERRDA